MRELQPAYKQMNLVYWQPRIVELGEIRTLLPSKREAESDGGKDNGLNRKENTDLKAETKQDRSEQLDPEKNS